MNNDLIKRIDDELATPMMPVPVRRLLRDCKAKQLLLEAINESLREQNTTLDAKLAELEATIERLSKPYVPMTNAEHYKIWAGDGKYMPIDDWNQDFMWEDERTIETATIARYNEQRGVK